MVPVSFQWKFGFSWLLLSLSFILGFMKILPGHSGLNYWSFVTLLMNNNEWKTKSLEKHDSHPFPLLSRSCRTECAVWHSYTSQTLLLSALWWTRHLPSGRPVSPKQTAVSHSDSTNYIKGQTSVSALNRDVFITDRLVKSNINQISTTLSAWHIQVQTCHNKDDSQDWCGLLTAAQIWLWLRSWPWWCHPTSDLQEDEQLVFHYITLSIVNGN